MVPFLSAIILTLVSNSYKHLGFLPQAAWLPVLQRHVSAVSATVSEHFRAIGCAGEVALVQAGEDFAKYRVEIRWVQDMPYFVQSSKADKRPSNCGCAATVYARCNEHAMAYR